LQLGPADVQYNLIALAMLAVGLALTIWALQGAIGFRIVAVREDEQAASAIGVNPMVYKVLALVTSAAGTGLVGALYFFYQLFVDPDIAFGPTISIEAILCAIVGGVGSIWGPVLGAAILIGISEIATSLTRAPPALLSFLSGRSGLDMVIYGVVLVAILLVAPRGVYGAFVSRRSA
jgi:branched-chain amino acid transport system permease protein